MNSKQILLLFVFGGLLWLLLNGNVGATTNVNQSPARCNNPGAQAWAQMNQAQRLAYGLCASWEASK
jgi:hypothetical protein